MFWWTYWSNIWDTSVLQEKSDQPKKKNCFFHCVMNDQTLHKKNRDKMYLWDNPSSDFMINLLLGNIFRENLNEGISLAEIATFRFPRKLSINRKLTFMGQYMCCQGSNKYIFARHQSFICLKRLCPRLSVMF